MKRPGEGEENARIDQREVEGGRGRKRKRMKEEKEKENSLGLERLENSLRRDPLVDGKMNHGKGIREPQSS